MVLFPGVILSSIILPKRQNGLWSSILFGIVFAVAQVHILFIIVLVIGFDIALVHYILISTTLFMVLGALGSRSAESITLKQSFKVPSQNMAIILMFGLAIRLALMIVASNSIAPDASLYSDYARSIVQGTFNSSVLGDGAVFSLRNNVDFLAHQGITYIFAISWLLLEPVTSGPNLILVIIGMNLILIGFNLTRRFFGNWPALFVAGILAFHPLFVFHSVVAYGPEVASLLFVASAIFLYGMGQCDRIKMGLVIGILIGLVDVIWAVNYYIICLVFPLIVGFKQGFRNINTLFAGILFIVLLLVKMVLLNPFIVMLTIVVVSCPLIKSFFRNRLLSILSIFYASMGVILAWRLPAILVSLLGAPSTPPERESIIQAIGASLNPVILVRFPLFMLFHISLAIVCIVAIILFKRMGQFSLILTISAFIAAVGTLKVLGSFSEDVLTISYIYSDSRFFLFSTFMIIIASAPFFQNLLSGIFAEAAYGPSKWMLKWHKKPVLAILCISISFIPGYVAYPMGLELVNIENRYGWQSIAEIMTGIGDEYSIFLVDRARELAWITNRNTATMRLSAKWLPNSNASREILALVEQYGADHIVIDDYFLKRWLTLKYLLRDPIKLGNSVPIDIETLASHLDQNSTELIQSLTLVGSTCPNKYGRYAHIFGLDWAKYNRVQTINLALAGWEATRGGSISSTAEGVYIMVGGGGYTNTQRTEESNLDLKVHDGFISFSIIESNASLARIGIYNDLGVLLGYAQSMGDNKYIFLCGEITIGDIRMVVEGLAGTAILVKDISIWNFKQSE